MSSGSDDGDVREKRSTSLGSLRRLLRRRRPSSGDSLNGGSGGGGGLSEAAGGASPTSSQDSPVMEVRLRNLRSSSGSRIRLFERRSREESRLVVEGSVRITVHEAQLDGAGLEQRLNPNVQLVYARQRFRTPTRRGTTTPRWDDPPPTFLFVLTHDETASRTPLYVKAWHKGVPLGKTLIGGAALPAEVLYSEDEVTTWVDLYTEYEGSLWASYDARLQPTGRVRLTACFTPSAQKMDADERRRRAINLQLRQQFILSQPLLNPHSSNEGPSSSLRSSGSEMSSLAATGIGADDGQATASWDQLTDPGYVEMAGDLLDDETLAASGGGATSFPSSSFDSTSSPFDTASPILLNPLSLSPRHVFPSVNPAAAAPRTTAEPAPPPRLSAATAAAAARPPSPGMRRTSPGGSRRRRRRGASCSPADMSLGGHRHVGSTAVAGLPMVTLADLQRSPTPTPTVVLTSSSGSDARVRARSTPQQPVAGSNATGSEAHGPSVPTVTYNIDSNVWPVRNPVVSVQGQDAHDSPAQSQKPPTTWSSATPQRSGSNSAAPSPKVVRLALTRTAAVSRLRASKGRSQSQSCLEVPTASRNGDVAINSARGRDTDAGAEGVVQRARARTTPTPRSASSWLNQSSVNNVRAGLQDHLSPQSVDVASPTRNPKATILAQAVSSMTASAPSSVNTSQDGQSPSSLRRSSTPTPPALMASAVDSASRATVSTPPPTICVSDLDNFNERFQTAMEQMRAFDMNTDLETRLRVSTDLVDLAQDFMYSARAYGKIIISNHNVPQQDKIIRSDPSYGGVLGGEKYRCGDILFKVSNSSGGIFGDDLEAAAKVAGNELRGAIAFFNAEVKGLCFPLMATLDYKGYRLVASSVLPISRRTLRYGSADGGRHVLFQDTRLYERVRQACQLLNLKPHEVCGSQDEEKVTLWSAADVEGHKGKDGRTYLVDFSRTHPPVHPCAPHAARKGSHLFRLFRPEFVASYERPLCADALSSFISGTRHARQHNDELKVATMHLLERTIPEFARSLVSLLDDEYRLEGSYYGFALTENLHRYGINCRYFGLVHNHIPSSHPEHQNVVLVEMVARVCKNLLRAKMRELVAQLKAPLDTPFHYVVVELMNNIFGRSSMTEYYWSEYIVERLREDYLWKGEVQDLRTYVESISAPAVANMVHGSHSAVAAARTVGYRVSEVNGLFLIFHRLRIIAGLEFSQNIVIDLMENPSMFSSAQPFDSMDLLRMHERVKHMNVVSSAMGFLLVYKAQRAMHQKDFVSALRYFEKAEASYREALNSTPNDFVLLRSLAKVNMECAVAEKGASHQRGLPSLQSSTFLSRADQFYRKALDADVEDVSTLTEYACFLESCERYDDAEDYYLFSLASNPNQLYCLRRYADFLQFVKKEEATAEAFLMRYRATYRIVVAWKREQSVSTLAPAMTSASRVTNA